MPADPSVLPAVLLTPDDLYLFNEGNHHSIYRSLGAHTGSRDGIQDASFDVWAPNAERVSVIGDFNGWQAGTHRLAPQGSYGIWSGFIPGIGHGAIYKYRIDSRYNGDSAEKADPFATHAENPPKTGSIVWELEYAWGDDAWMAARSVRNAHAAPWSVYEVHLGSWMRAAHDGNRWLSYREIAPLLVEHLLAAGPEGVPHRREVRQCRGAHQGRQRADHGGDLLGVEHRAEAHDAVPPERIHLVRRDRAQQVHDRLPQPVTEKPPSTRNVCPVT